MFIFNRTECLEAIEGLLEVAGMNVCQPNPASALKEVAKQISDKDKSVRNAALNLLVLVYFREGEKLYKYIGTVRIFFRFFRFYFRNTFFSTFFFLGILFSGFF